MGDENDGNALGNILWDCVVLDAVRPAQYLYASFFCMSFVWTEERSSDD